MEEVCMLGHGATIKPALGPIEAHNGGNTDVIIAPCQAQALCTSVGASIQTVITLDTSREWLLGE